MKDYLFKGVVFLRFRLGGLSSKGFKGLGFGISGGQGFKGLGFRVLGLKGWGKYPKVRASSPRKARSKDASDSGSPTWGRGSGCDNLPNTTATAVHLRQPMLDSR